MIIIGITGSIGMGKSAIAGMLKQFRIPVFDSDREVKDILENNSDVKNQIFDLWPDVILLSKNENKINKSLLSKKVFSRREHRKILEKIIHPLVQKKRNLFIKNFCDSFIIALDIPLLYETKSDNICDYIFLAHTSEIKQKQRVLARENMTEEKFKLINKAQWNHEKKKSKRPYLVTTSYGKFISFIIITVYLLKIILKRKIFKL